VVEVNKISKSEKLLHGSNGCILALILLAAPHVIEIKTDIAVLKRSACECRAKPTDRANAKQPGATNFLAKASNEQ
jgi:hypothetical protein